MINLNSTMGGSIQKYIVFPSLKFHHRKSCGQASKCLISNSHNDNDNSNSKSNHDVRLNANSHNSVSCDSPSTSVTKRARLMENAVQLMGLVGSERMDRKPVWAFSRSELNSLRDSITRVQETAMDENGHELFQRVFKYDSEFKALIKEKRNYSDERVESLFMTHAKRVLDIISDVVNHLDQPQYVRNAIITLGHIHSSFRVEETHMDMMLCNFMDALQKFDWQHWNDRLEDVWIRFLAVVVAYIVVGLRNINVNENCNKDSLNIEL